MNYTHPLLDTALEGAANNIVVHEAAFYETTLQSRALFNIFFFSFCSKWPSGNRFSGRKPFLWFLFGDKPVPTSSSSCDLGMQNIVLLWNVRGPGVKFRQWKDLVWSKLWVAVQFSLCACNVPNWRDLYPFPCSLRPNGKFWILFSVILPAPSTSNLPEVSFKTPRNFHLEL